MENAKKIEVVLSGMVLAVTLGAPAVSYGAAACTTGSATAVTGNPASFVKDTFTPKCSTAVTVNYTQTDAAIAARSGTAGGMHTFGGSSEGGGVIQCESSSVAAPHEAAAQPTTALSGCPA